jgi:hypothetical protein
MTLSAKPDFERAALMWDHFWAKEVLKRPLVVASAWKPGTPGGDHGLRYYRALTGRHDEQMREIDKWLDSTIFMAESMPLFGPDLGPDQFAAFLGTELEYSEDSPDTNWVKPVVEDWDRFLPLRLDPNNKAWKLILDYSRKLAKHSQGRYLLSVADLHGNADALSALRTPAKLCMDFYDCPDKVAEAMRQVRAFFRPVYDALYEAGGMGGVRGSGGWAPFWCRGKFATIQSDYLALVGPEIGRKYILPALEEEASYLDHCVYHLDGPGCIPHLDNLLAIKRIDVIQWVSGAGQRPMHEWTDILKRCQKAGKGLQLYDIQDIETVKRLASELRPEGLVYCLSMGTEEKIREVTDWLERNT